MRLFETQLKNEIWKVRFPLHAAVCEKKIREVERLVHCGVSLNDLDTYGTTPLLYSTQAEDIFMVRTLLRAGADPNKSSVDGTLPLWVAAEDFDFDEIAKVLRQYGARK